MKLSPLPFAALLLINAAAQSTAPSASASRPTTTAPASRTSGAAGAKGAARPSGVVPPDPDLFDGSKFEAEERPEYGMLGEFEMPGSNQQSDKAGGQPGSPNGQQQQAPNPLAAGAAGAAGGPQSSSGAQQAAAAGGGGAQGAENSAAGGGGAQGGAQQDAAAGGAQGGAGGPQGPEGSASAAGGSGPAGRAEGIQASGLSGGPNAASQDSVKPNGNPSVSRIGSAELRIETYPDADKDIVGREATPGGTQGSNRPTPNGKGGQGSQNQNMGVEKGKVIPKGL